MAGRDRAKIERLLNNIDRSWMKHVRCWLCGRRICVNNYSDRRVRIPRYKGVIYCPWHHSPEQEIELIRSFVELLRMECIGPGGKKCKCPPCKAQRKFFKGKIKFERRLFDHLKLVEHEE